MAIGTCAALIIAPTAGNNMAFHSKSYPRESVLSDSRNDIPDSQAVQISALFVLRPPRDPLSLMRTA